MKISATSILVISLIILLQSCTKNAPGPKPYLIGKWVEDPGFFREGREWDHFQFTKTDTAKFWISQADGPDVSHQTLTYTISGNILTTYKLDGTIFRGPYYIKKVTNSRLILKYPGTETEEKYSRY